MSAFGMILSTTMLAQTVRMTIPYACASLGGVIPEACAISMKSPPAEIDEDEALALIRRNWATHPRFGKAGKHVVKAA